MLILLLHAHRIITINIVNCPAMMMVVCKMRKLNHENFKKFGDFFEISRTGIMPKHCAKKITLEKIVLENLKTNFMLNAHKIMPLIVMPPSLNIANHLMP